MNPILELQQPVTVLPDGTRLVPLPRKMWIAVERCDCSVCRGQDAFFDTLAVPETGNAYVVHNPKGARSL